MQNDYLYIYTVYQEGSFSKAAEKLYLTQPALSIAIQKIESSLGMPLFDRSKRPLQLTEAGEAYVNTIKQMQFLEQDLEQEIQDIRSLNTGVLRIGASHYLNAFILPPVLSGFSKAYPGIQLELAEYGSNQINTLLAERKIDMTFSCNDIFMEHYERYPAFQDHVLLAVPSFYEINESHRSQQLTAADILAGKHCSPDCPTVPLEDFQDLEYIILGPGNNLRDRCLRLFEEKGLTPKIKLTLAQMATAHALAESGLAAAFTCDRLVTGPQDGLCYYRLDSQDMDRMFYIVLPDRRYTSHAVKMFIQYFLVNFI
ncbi:MAG TPA: LysR family transcriptional regulator [Candidatus Enterocloster faecavium]|uniref:LysR family transcriptional regulator n=1 Tax=Candidatus Enterocloster faecavium TaxID=2838560 RepID=A0A9D2L9A8_9FIRM|nr:LysR family transcriptional regulator [Candidatus Enterocloster faecavium]